MPPARDRATRSRVSFSSIETTTAVSLIRGLLGRAAPGCRAGRCPDCRHARHCGRSGRIRPLHMGFDRIRGDVHGNGSDPGQALRYLRPQDIRYPGHDNSDHRRRTTVAGITSAGAVSSLDAFAVPLRPPRCSGFLQPHGANRYTTGNCAASVTPESVWW